MWQDLLRALLAGERGQGALESAVLVGPSAHREARANRALRCKPATTCSCSTQLARLQWVGRVEMQLAANAPNEAATLRLEEALNSLREKEATIKVLQGQLKVSRTGLCAAWRARASDHGARTPAAREARERTHVDVGPMRHWLCSAF